jgi:ABC-2 type transport system ATP-binding protein
MRVREYLGFRGTLKGLTGRKRRERIAEVIDTCGLEEVKTRPIGRLSKGYTQRVGLADSLLHEPELLILDEPTIGLDPNQVRHIRSLIKSCSRRYTVLLSSHILSEVEMMCERVLIINRGRIVASDRPSDLLGSLKGGSRTVLEVRGPREAVCNALRAVPGTLRVASESLGDWQRLTCETEGGRDLRQELFRVVVENGWVLRELRQERQNLEDIFVAVTAESEREHAAGSGRVASPERDA